MSSKGKRKTHDKFPIECCVECEYQIGSRECHQCGDFYCDTCYWKSHSTGALMQHTYDVLIPLCTSCEDQERAHAVRVDCGGEQMCKRCYNSWWYPQGYECFTLPLETRSMRQYRDKVLQERVSNKNNIWILKYFTSFNRGYIKKIYWAMSEKWYIFWIISTELSVLQSLTTTTL